jgi:hypothetical protein
MSITCAPISSGARDARRRAALVTAQHRGWHPTRSINSRFSRDT